MSGDGSVSPPSSSERSGVSASQSSSCGGGSDNTHRATSSEEGPCEICCDHTVEYSGGGRQICESVSSQCDVLRVLRSRSGAYLSDEALVELSGVLDSHVMFSVCECLQKDARGMTSQGIYLMPKRLANTAIFQWLTAAAEGDDTLSKEAVAEACSTFHTEHVWTLRQLLEVFTVESAVRLGVQKDVAEWIFEKLIDDVVSDTKGRDLPLFKPFNPKGRNYQRLPVMLIPKESVPPTMYFDESRALVMGYSGDQRPRKALTEQVDAAWRRTEELVSELQRDEKKDVKKYVCVDKNCACNMHAGRFNNDLDPKQRGKRAEVAKLITKKGEEQKRGTRRPEDKQARAQRLGLHTGGEAESGDKAARERQADLARQQLLDEELAREDLERSKSEKAKKKQELVKKRQAVKEEERKQEEMELKRQEEAEQKRKDAAAAVVNKIKYDIDKLKRSIEVGKRAELVSEEEEARKKLMSRHKRQWVDVTQHFHELEKEESTQRDKLKKEEEAGLREVIEARKQSKAAIKSKILDKRKKEQEEAGTARDGPASVSSPQASAAVERSQEDRWPDGGAKRSFPYANMRHDMSSNTPAIVLQASRGNLDEMRRMLHDKPEFAQRTDRDGWSALTAAALNGHIKATKLLTEAGADVNAKTNAGDTAVHAASLNGHSMVLRHLLDKGASASVENKEGWVPLGYAAQNGHRDCVQILITAGANVNARSHCKWTPLMAASLNGHFTIVESLATKGADVNAKSDAGWTATFCAARNAHVSCCDALRNHGADVHAYNRLEETPLLTAARGGHTHTVDWLINHGADVNRPNADAWTPLLFACKAGYTNVCRALLCNGAKIEYKNAKGWTALAAACFNGKYETAEYLLQRGADDTVLTEGGWTILMHATKSGNPRLAKMVIDRCDSSRVNLQNDKGWTALMIVAKHNQPQIARFLVDAGATINTPKTQYNWSAFMVACSEGFFEIVKLFIENGGNPHPRGNKSNCVPIIAAAKHGRLPVLRLLHEYGADLRVVDDQQGSPLTLAIKNNHENVVTYLRDAGVDCVREAPGGHLPREIAMRSGNQPLVSVLLAKPRHNQTNIPSASTIRDNVQKWEGWVRAKEQRDAELVKQEKAAAARAPKAPPQEKRKQEQAEKAAAEKEAAPVKEAKTKPAKETKEVKEAKDDGDDRPARRNGPPTTKPRMDDVIFAAPEVRKKEPEKARLERERDERERQERQERDDERREESERLERQRGQEEAEQEMDEAQEHAYDRDHDPEHDIDHEHAHEHENSYAVDKLLAHDAVPHAAPEASGPTTIDELLAWDDDVEGFSVKNLSSLLAYYIDSDDAVSTLRDMISQKKRHIEHQRKQMELLEQLVRNPDMPYTAIPHPSLTPQPQGYVGSQMQHGHAMHGQMMPPMGRMHPGAPGGPPGAPGAPGQGGPPGPELPSGFFGIGGPPTSMMRAPHRMDPNAQPFHGGVVQGLGPMPGVPGMPEIPGAPGMQELRFDEPDEELARSHSLPISHEQDSATVDLIRSLTSGHDEAMPRSSTEPDRQDISGAVDTFSRAMTMGPVSGMSPLSTKSVERSSDTEQKDLSGLQEILNLLK